MSIAEQHLDFTTRLLPALTRLARRTYRTFRDADSAVQDYIGDAWEGYVRLIRRQAKPYLHDVIREAGRHRRPITGPGAFTQFVSMSDPAVSKRVAAICA